MYVRWGAHQRVAVTDTPTWRRRLHAVEACFARIERNGMARSTLRFSRELGRTLLQYIARYNTAC